MLTDQIKFILNTYIEDLNIWFETNEGEVPPYTIESFTVTDPSRSLYGSLEVLSETYTLLHLSINDGEEGGAHELICTRYPDDRVTSITQVFDTTPRLVWTEDHGFVSRPDKDYRTNL